MIARILKSDDNQFYCIIVAGNGQVLFTSETYKRKASIMKMVKKNFPLLKVADESK